MSNYDITQAKAAEAFLDYDQGAMVSTLGLDQDGEYLYVTMLGRRYRVNRASGVVEWSDDEWAAVHLADHNAAMTIYDRLCYGQGAMPAGEFATLRSLAPFQGSPTILGHGFFADQAQTFDQDEEGLVRACTALGGTPTGGGDVAFDLPLFADFPVLLRFWHSDDEFPATLELYFDTNALQFMHYETLWYAASHLISRLTQ